MSAKANSTLILGIGNPILSDDAVGIRITEEIKELYPEVDTEVASTSGMELVDCMEGYDRVIIIDSVKTGEHPPGTLLEIPMEELSKAVNISTFHNLNFPTALELGKRYLGKMPEKITIYAIEITDNVTFSEKCTSEVEDSIKSNAKKIMKIEFHA
ncbi:hydrogenase maturation protease [bacterium]|nr:hydrogenase maturation protease [bacterium]